MHQFLFVGQVLSTGTVQDQGLAVASDLEVAVAVFDNLHVWHGVEHGLDVPPLEVVGHGVLEEALIDFFVSAG